MNINYNQVALRQLRPTLQDILGRINTAAHDTRHPIDKGLVEEAAQMRPGLEMVGCTAVAALANTLSDAVLGLSNPARRGWEGERLAHIAAATSALATAMPRLLDDLSEGRPTQPVLLYGAWRDLLEAMRATPPPPETLFQPDPDFDDEKFVRLDADYLRDIVQAASARLAALAGEVEASLAQATALSDPDITAHLAAASEIVDWVYRLRHRRGFQAFWLTSRAVLVAMQQTAPPADCTPATLLALLRDAHIEMERLAADSRQASPGVLMTWVAPLLPPWPAAWQGVAWLDEFRRRMRLDAFWEALGSLSAPAGQPVVDAASALGLLRQAWGQWLDGSGSARSAARALSEWTAAAPHGEAVQSLLRAMSKVASWCLSAPAGSPPDEQAVTEVATAIVLQEDVLAWGLTDAAAARLHAEAARLDAMMVPGRPGLSALPVPRWDSAHAVRDSHAARAMAAGEVAKDLMALEERLSDIHRGDIAVADIRAELSGLLPSLEVGASVLSMLRLPAASVVAADVLTRVDHLAGRATAPASADMDALSLEMTALADFLRALAEGAEEPLERLHPALAMLPPEMAAALASAQPSTASAPPPAAPAPVIPPVPAIADNAEAPAVIPPAAVSPAAAPPVVQPPLATPHVHATPAPTNQEWVARLTQPGGVLEDARSGLDEEIVDSFVDEASSILAEITATRRDIAAAPSADPELVETLRRFFHTIKGAARLAGLPAAGEVAWWGERISARWTRGGDFDEPVGQVAGLLADAVRQYRTEGAARIEAADVWPSLASFVFPPADAATPAAPHENLSAQELPATPAPAAPSGVAEPQEPVMESMEPTSTISSPPSAAATPSPAAPSAAAVGLSTATMDEEYRAALQEDWRTQDALLAKAAASGDAASLRSAAHTLRSLASLLGWEGWSGECADVERAILASESVDVEVWASRWRDAIAEAVDGLVPSTEKTTPVTTEPEPADAQAEATPTASEEVVTDTAEPAPAEEVEATPDVVDAEEAPSAPQSPAAVLEDASQDTAAMPSATDAVEVVDITTADVEVADADAAKGAVADTEAEAFAIPSPHVAPDAPLSADPEPVSPGAGAEPVSAPLPEGSQEAVTLDDIPLVETEAASAAGPASEGAPEEDLYDAVAAFRRDHPELAPTADASPDPGHHGHLVPEGDEGAEWDEVFAAFDTMLDACTRIGAALERIAARRAASTTKPDPVDD